MDKLVRIKIDRDIAADNVIYADNQQLRRKGVLGREEIAENEGVLMVMPCKTGLSLFHSIHMFGVPFDLAAAWLNRNRKIIHLKIAKPGRIYFPPGFFTDTAYILELHPKHYERLKRSTRIDWEENG